MYAGTFIDTFVLLANCWSWVERFKVTEKWLPEQGRAEKGAEKGFPVQGRTVLGTENWFQEQGRTVLRAGELVLGAG